MKIKTFKYAIALTGGIATGKSTVSKILQDNLFKVIDADLIAHKLLDENSKKIISLFGKKYVKHNKVLRKELGKIIFSDQEQKIKLENLLHPLIKEEIEKQAESEDLKKKTYFIDIPLFFESMNYDINKCLLIYVNKNIQIQRLIKRDNISDKEARLKISNQMNIEEKKDKADYIINNESNIEDLQKEVQKLIREIL